ncbi:MAG: FAD-dependent oxidoreductase [Gammaproteobacteria bacterium]
MLMLSSLATALRVLALRFCSSRAGQKVALLEARRVGLGTTGRSTGNLYVTTDKHLSTLTRSYGLATVRDVIASRSAAIDFIEQTVKDEGIDCHFQRVPFGRMHAYEMHRDVQSN